MEAQQTEPSLREEGLKCSKIRSITEDVPLPDLPVPAVERNFTHFFATDVQGAKQQDQYLYRHPNGLCVLGLAPSHPALEPDRKITKVDFDVGKRNRQHCEVKGKAKKGAQMLEENSLICRISMVDDTSYLIRSCLKGVLLEVNARLVEEPEVLTNKAHSEGFIAIIMVRPEGWVKAESKLLTREAYTALRTPKPVA